MKSGATMLITVGFLLVFVRHITNAKDSPMCDFNMDMAKQKHRRMNAKKEIVIYIVFLSGQHVCNLCFSLQHIIFHLQYSRTYRCPAFKERVDMLRQTWLRHIRRSSRMDYGFFIGPGTDASTWDNKVYDPIAIVSWRKQLSCD